MQSLHSTDNRDHEERDEADFSSPDDHESEEEEAHEKTKSRPKRRVCVIEEDEDESAVLPRRVTRRMSAGNVEPSHSGAVDEGGGEHDEEDEAPAARPVSRREPPVSISGIVGRQRASGSLPSRREAVLQLMDLQTRLQREDRSRDSAVCTNAILTLQELIKRVEELQHTI